MNQMTGQSFNPNQPAGPILPYANNAQYGPENQGAGNNIWQTDYVGGNDMAGNPINNNINPTNNGLLQVSNPGMEGYGQVPGQAFGGGNFDMGKAGQALGQGLQNIGANMGQGFQFGGYGQQNRGRY